MKRARTGGVSSPEERQYKSQKLQQRAKVQPHKLTPQSVLPVQKTQIESIPTAFGPLMYFLTQTPNGILQSNPVIYWGMQDLKNTTKIPSAFLLSRAGLEQQQHYGYFYSLSINTHAFAHCLSCVPTAAHTICWVQERKRPLQCRLQAWQSCKKAVLSSYKWRRKTNHTLRSQTKWWCFSWEQCTQHRLLQDRKFHMPLL